MSLYFLGRKAGDGEGALDATPDIFKRDYC